jgi:hypothetical protein
MEPDAVEVSPRRNKRDAEDNKVGITRRRRDSEGRNPISGVRRPHGANCRTLSPSRPSYGRSNLHWHSGGSSLSLADALRRRPRRHHRPHRYIARDVAGLTFRSSMARSIGAPPYFFLTAFRFAGAFFFAAGFAFALTFVVAFFAILPS